jgi:hypothetical protein
MAAMPDFCLRRRWPGPRSWLARVLALLAALAVAALLVAGCTSGSPAGPEPSGNQLTAALGHWASFPARGVTRPLVVLTGPGVTGPAGFPTAAAKIAFLDGAIDLPRSLPAGPATEGGLPLISAARAGAVLTSARVRGLTPSTRLTVTRVRLGAAAFGTDRGQQALPAWQFTIRGVSGPVAVLAVAVAGRFWPAGLNHVTSGIRAAQPGRSGRVLTLTAEGAQAGTGPCQATYAVRQRSSAHAVAIDVVARPHDGQAGCASVGYRVTLSVTLPAPLGGRVLVDARNSAPIPVTQALAGSS